MRSVPRGFLAIAVGVALLLVGCGGGLAIPTVPATPTVAATTAPSAAPAPTPVATTAPSLAIIAATPTPLAAATLPSAPTDIPATATGAPPAPLGPSASEPPATAAPRPTATAARTAPTATRVAPSAAPATAAASGYQASASVSNAAPTRNSRVTVTAKLTQDGKGVAGAVMLATWRYKTTVSECAGGPSGADGTASCTRDISSATPGYTVTIDVAFSYQGRTIRTSTSFTPRSGG